jgi:hypothetical protein
MALQTAQLLGRLLERERQTARGRDAFEVSYRREWDALFTTRVRAALVLQRVLFSAPMREVISALLRSVPSLLGIAVRMTRGRGAST